VGKKLNDGRSPGSGRTVGSLNKVTNATREAAMASGLLPHEWLLKVARGDAIEHTTVVDVYDAQGNVIDRRKVTIDHYATFSERIDCAKAAASYYAPKLGAQMVAVNNDGGFDFVGILDTLSKKLPG